MGIRLQTSKSVFCLLIDVVYTTDHITKYKRIKISCSPELLTEKGVHGDYGYGFSLVARSGGGHNKRATIKRSITRLRIGPGTAATATAVVSCRGSLHTARHRHPLLLHYYYRIVSYRMRVPVCM